MSGSTHGTPTGTTTPRPGAGVGRLGLLTLAGAAGGGFLLLRARDVVLAAPGRVAAVPVETWVELAVLAAGTLAAAWLLLSGLVALAVVAASLLGHRWRAGEAAVERVAPAMVRRLVRSAVGVGVGAGLALAPTAALAADGPAPAPQGNDASVVLDLGWQPTANDQPGAGEVDAAGTDDPTGEVDAAPPGAAPPVHDVAASPVVRTTTTSRADDDGTTVVLRGDTLWDIASRTLGGAPTDAEILREVTRWHDANRDVVGPDPDSILPGQILRAPA